MPSPLIEKRPAVLVATVGFAALALMPVVPAYAQDDHVQDSGDIVVIGQGLPLPPGTPAYGSAVIDRDRLTGSASGRLEEVLADVAGLQQFRRSDSRSANPSAQGVTLRALGGNATSRALVLLDGVPQADPFFGYIPFNAIVPDRLSAARITRGGGSGPFGAGAVAGTIELASATRTDLPDYAASLFFGSRDSVMASASVTPDLGNGFVSISGHYDRGDGFYTTPLADRGPADVPSAYENWSTSIRAVAPVNELTEIQASALVYRDHRTLRFAGADSSASANDASIRVIHRGDWQVDALAYIQARNFTNKVISSTSFKLVLDQRNTPSTGVGGKIEVRPPLGADHVLRLGVDVRRASGELFEEPYNARTGLATARRHAGGNSTSYGLFVEDDWTLGQLVLTGGGRIDRWRIGNGFYRELTPAGMVATDDHFASRHGVEATGRVGALWNASDAFALRAAAYTGFRLPTLNELYRPFTVFPVTTQANAALDLEQIKGAEAGFDVKPVPGLRLGVTAFYNRLDNAVANVTIAPNLRQRRNLDAVIAKGVELTAFGRLGSFDLSASYAYNHSKVQATGASQALDGFDPAQSPRHSASGTLAWAPAQGPRISTTLRYVGKQYEDDLQTDVLPAALTVDAVVSMPVTNRLRIVARAENLFDETIITRNTGNAIDLGTPQTFWIGLHFNG